MSRAYNQSFYRHFYVDVYSNVYLLYTISAKVWGPPVLFMNSAPVIAAVV